MYVKSAALLMLLTLGTNVFAEVLGEWNVVQIDFLRPLTLGERRTDVDDATVIDETRYFAAGRSADLAPASSTLSRLTSSSGDLTRPECLLSHKLKITGKPTPVEMVSAFLGFEHQITYSGSKTQMSSMRTTNEDGIYDAWIKIEGGTIHCRARTPIDQQVLNAVFAGTEVKVWFLHPCRHETVGSGVQKRVCE